MSDTPTKTRRAAAGAIRDKSAPAKVPKAVLYARYSTNMQSDMSCEDQLAACREVARQRGLEIADEFHDSAVSGRTAMTDRDGLVAMLKRVERGDIRWLIVEGIDRIGRRSTEITGLAGQFEAQ